MVSYIKNTSLPLAIFVLSPISVHCTLVFTSILSIFTALQFRINTALEVSKIYDQNGRHTCRPTTGQAQVKTLHLPAIPFCWGWEQS